jgi:hypothetical protein
MSLFVGLLLDAMCLRCSIIYEHEREELHRQCSPAAVVLGIIDSSCWYRRKIETMSVTR